MIKYRKLRKYKYGLEKDYIIMIDIKPERAVGNEYVILETSGKLTMKKGYQWDGPSGPTIDTKNFMEGSLVHDALYQLMRLGEISRSWQDYADNLLVEICRSKGMSRFRAWYVYNALRLAGKCSTDSEVVTIE